MNVAKLCNGCDDCNQKSSMFQVLSEDELRIINMDRYSVRFHEGEVILKQGTKADYLISVVEGFAKTCIEGHNERNLILDYIKPWRLVGGPAAHVGDKRHCCTGDPGLFYRCEEFYPGIVFKWRIFRTGIDSLLRQLPVCPGANGWT